MKKNINIGHVLQKVCERLKKPAPEGVSEEKYDSCVQQVKAKQGKKVNAYAVCSAALQRSDIEKFDTQLQKAWSKTANISKPKLSSNYIAPKMQIPKPKTQQMQAPKTIPTMPAIKKDDNSKSVGDVTEHAYTVVGQGAVRRFFNGLRRLKDKMHSSKNIFKTESGTGKKYITVSQHWSGGIYNRASGKHENPVLDAGKKRPEHIDDLHRLKNKGHIYGWSEHTEPVKRWGEETYEVHPDGKLKFVHADYDTSG